jgi:hypothetical protein
MNFSDVVIILWVFSFFSFSEGILRQSKRWQRILNLFETGVVTVVTWRANSDIKGEIKVLTKFFGYMGFATFIFFVFSLWLKSGSLQSVFGIVFLFSFFSWFSFKWTFEHLKQLKDYYPMFLLLTLAPWLLFLFDLIEPRAHFLEIFKPIFEMSGIAWGSPFKIATIVSLIFLGFFLLNYFFTWIIFAPFPIFILACLWISSRIANYLRSKFNREVVMDISIFIQLMAPIYLYFAGR